jgi:mannose-6-phosphate isomerase-like protein (cupin superfamily)
MLETKKLPENPDATAPDGSEVKILLALKSGSMAHFELKAGKVSHAVAHKTVEEIWYFLEGEGEMWRKHGKQEEIVRLRAGTCITIPVGTLFQFHTTGESPLKAVAITMPPWPGDDEAYNVDGIWKTSHS